MHFLSMTDEYVLMTFILQERPAAEMRWSVRVTMSCPCCLRQLISTLSRSIVNLINHLCATECFYRSEQIWYWMLRYISYKTSHWSVNRIGKGKVLDFPVSCLWFSMPKVWFQKKNWYRYNQSGYNWGSSLQFWEKWSNTRLLSKFEAFASRLRNPGSLTSKIFLMVLWSAWIKLGIVKFRRKFVFPTWSALCKTLL